MFSIKIGYCSAFCTGAPGITYNHLPFSMSPVAIKRGTTVKAKESRVWRRDEAELGWKRSGVLGAFTTDRQKDLSVSRTSKRVGLIASHNLGSKYQVGPEKTGAMESVVAFLI